MKWPGPEELAQLVPLPAPYRPERITRAHIAPLIASLKQWYPDISVGVNSCFLLENFYRDRVCLDAGDDRDFCVVTIWSGDDLVGMWSGEREADSLAIFGRLIVMAPAHRGARAAVMIMAGMANVGRVMGAAFLYCMVTLKNAYLQEVLENEGYQLLGFMPGYDRQIVAPGVVKRVYQAVYAKLLVAEDEVRLPDPQNLTPRAKMLFDLLFSH
jgi:hypothetical protein